MLVPLLIQKYRAVNGFPQLVELGAVILDRVPGPHFTFVDPRLNNSQAIVQRTRQLMLRFERSGIPGERIVVSVRTPANPSLLEKLKSCYPDPGH